MTATYSLSTDIGKIRLHINDTDTANPKLTDEEIQYAIDEKTTVAASVILCIQLLMMKVSDPNFTADWLTVSNDTAFKSYEKMLTIKCQQLGVPLISATANHTYRPDSRQDEAPDFSEVQAGADDDQQVGYLVIL